MEHASIYGILFSSTKKCFLRTLDSISSSPHVALRTSRCNSLKRQASLGAEHMPQLSQCEILVDEHLHRKPLEW